MHIYPQKSCESYYLESFHAYLPNSLTDISETLLVWAAAHCEKEIAKKTTKSFMIEIIPPGLLRSAGTPRKYLHGCDDAICTMDDGYIASIGSSVYRFETRKSNQSRVEGTGIL